MVKTAFVNVSKSIRNEGDSQFDINFRFEVITGRDENVFTFPYVFANQHWFHKFFKTIPDSEPENLFSLYLNESEDQLTVFRIFSVSGKDEYFSITHLVRKIALKN